MLQNSFTISGGSTEIHVASIDFPLNKSQIWLQCQHLPGRPPMQFEGGHFWQVRQVDKSGMSDKWTFLALATSGHFWHWRRRPFLVIEHGDALLVDVWRTILLMAQFSLN